MPIVNFIGFTGQRHTVAAADNQVLMQVAVDNGVPGIDADCGGQCACATCHVYIESPWAAMVPRMDERENEMLELTNERRESSRLACQVVLSPELDGIEVHLPEGQH